MYVSLCESMNKGGEWSSDAVGRVFIADGLCCWYGFLEEFRKKCWQRVFAAIAESSQKSNWVFCVRVSRTPCVLPNTRIRIVVRVYTNDERYKFGTQNNKFRVSSVAGPIEWSSTGGGNGLMIYKVSAGATRQPRSVFPCRSPVT